MKKTKTQKGVQASIAGFVLFILTNISLSYNSCFGIILYAITGTLWLAGIGWIYSDRKSFRERHGKSLEMASWIFGIATLTLIIGVLYYAVEMFYYVTIQPDILLASSDVHELYTVNVNFNYFLAISLVLIGLSRVFAVIELEGKRGRQVLAVALVLMIAITIVAVVQVTTAFQDRDSENQRDTTTTSYKKSTVQNQFSTIQDQTRLFSLLVVMHEAFFAAAYFMVSSRIESGELKPRASEEE